MNNLGNRIRMIRKEKKLTLQNVADKIGSSPIVISRYERGERNPNTEMLTKIANALGVTTSELIEDTDSQRKSIVEKEVERMISKFDVDPSIIKNNIKLIRFKKDMSTSDFANYLNSVSHITLGKETKIYFDIRETITDDMVSDWEKGEYLPNTESLVALSEISNFSIEKLLKEKIEIKVNSERLMNVIKSITVQDFNQQAFKALIQALDDAEVAIFENTEILNLYNHNYYYYEKNNEMDVKYLIDDKLSLIKYLEEKIVMFNDIIQDDNYPSEMKIDLTIDIIFISKQINKIKEFHSL
ncbi:helix-turn-helix domain-containing protein [Marinilactibacillus psychrotolerans]|uniref:helix-turn-helix domain-containing protein n=1 Tax=Marinilactibacillus psychrotolerans TaxID=191770 RepID=UPI0038876E4D